jgi:PleD family two-component response regulator
VDHFKKFNDTHGHDVGDQVLRLVAARLAEVGGGGKTYRYGGEEFAVLFRDRGVKEALPHLERARETIENYHMVIRGSDRPSDAEAGRSRRGRNGIERAVSVTVSIGVAERSDWLPTPDEVIRGADEALYRAKKRGRNRVFSR